ncbi:hypothetical protein ACQ86N_34280 [Puia sp. P3]|uniref:hypothetical protein n=1 Tax=Puia sp. P3 TaxID=3423952 RepID=UPI003D674B9D
MKHLFIAVLAVVACQCMGQGGEVKEQGGKTKNQAGKTKDQGGKTKNDLTIVIIRHGEKYAAGSNLNCKGLNRALHIPAVINKQFGRPLVIYVPTVKTGAVTSEDRMFQTATPLAVTDSVAVNSEFDETNTKGLADFLKTQNGLQLVVWEHTNIPRLGHALGLGKDSLSWQGSDFDSIWIVTFPNGRKHPPIMRKSVEGLNGLPNQCPTGRVRVLVCPDLGGKFWTPSQDYYGHWCNFPLC